MSERVLWVDDSKPAPEGYSVARTYDDALRMLRKYEWDEVHLDHDLGDRQGRTGFDLLIVESSREAQHREPLVGYPRRARTCRRARPHPVPGEPHRGLTNECTGVILVVYTQPERAMRVWTYPEKRYETLGAERWQVSWHQLTAKAAKRLGDDARPQEESRDFDYDNDLNEHYRAFPTEAAARACGEKVLASGVVFFGAVTLVRQVVDWFVEEDGVAEWVDAGTPEELS